KEPCFQTKSLGLSHLQKNGRVKCWNGQTLPIATHSAHLSRTPEMSCYREKGLREGGSSVVVLRCSSLPKEQFFGRQIRIGMTPFYFLKHRRKKQNQKQLCAGSAIMRLKAFFTRQTVSFLPNRKMKLIMTSIKM